MTALPPILPATRTAGEPAGHHTAAGFGDVLASLLTLASPAPAGEALLAAPVWDGHAPAPDAMIEANATPVDAPAADGGPGTGAGVTRPGTALPQDGRAGDDDGVPPGPASSRAEEAARAPGQHPAPGTAAPLGGALPDADPDQPRPSEGLRASGRPGPVIGGAGPAVHGDAVASPGRPGEAPDPVQAADPVEAQDPGEAAFSSGEAGGLPDPGARQARAPAMPTPMATAMLAGRDAHDDRDAVRRAALAAGAGALRGEPVTTAAPAGASEAAPASASGPGEHGSPVARSALAQRVAAIVEQLENAPPPRRMTVEVGELRLSVSLRGDTVHVSSSGSPTPEDWREDLAAGLAERGLTLAGEHRDGERRDERHDGGETASRPDGGRSDSGRRGSSTDRPRMPAGLRL